MVNWRRSKTVMRYKVSENFVKGSKYCFVDPLGQTVNVGGDSNERNYTG